MRSDLQQKLYKKYPKIFAQKDLSMKETCMCWGIDCEDGWYSLIDCLCAQIENHMYNERSQAKYEKREPHEYIQATQVKEKFGGLRFSLSTIQKKQAGLFQWLSVCHIRYARDAVQLRM